jgi:hypothetical protein
MLLKRKKSPEMYSDRLPKLSEDQTILNKEAVAVISGLSGFLGKHIRLLMPDTVERALNRAIVTTNVKTSERDGRAFKEKAFAVRGGRGYLQRPSGWNPQNESQEGRYRVGRGITSTGQHPRARGAWRGTRSFRTGSRTLLRDGAAPGMGVGLYRGTSAGGGGSRLQILSGLGVGHPQERARHQDRRTMTIVTPVATLICFSVIIVGFMGLSDERIPLCETAEFT